MHPTILLQLAELRTDERLHAAATRRLTRRTPRAPLPPGPTSAVVRVPTPVPARTRTRPTMCPQGC
jgi:hypothetical protein